MLCQGKPENTGPTPGIRHSKQILKVNLNKYIYDAFIETLAYEFFGDVIFINIMFCYCLITRHTKILIALV